ncbi:MAG: MBL fold metallo-hydrolase [Candidatus Binatia bacterium]
MRENYLRKVIFFTIALVWVISDGSLGAQDLGRHFQKIRDGIYVYGVDDVAGRDPSSNCGIIITQEGVVLIDSGPNPPDSLTIFKAVQQLTPLPIRFLINTETHNDHTTGNFVFSPPALVIGAAGASAGMKNYYDPKRNEKLIAESNEMREAFRGFRVVTPHIEFNDRMTLNLGERALELIQLKNIHSDADTAIWLPKERVLFSAAVAAVKRFGFLRPFVTIENIKSDIKKLKALQPEIIVPAHGRPTTVQLLDETDKFYDVLLERVGKQIAQGKSLEEIKKNPDLPAYKTWSGGKSRLDTNIEAAYRALKNN